MFLLYPTSRIHINCLDIISPGLIGLRSRALEGLVFIVCMRQTSRHNTHTYPSIEMKKLERNEQFNKPIYTSTSRYNVIRNLAKLAGFFWEKNPLGQ